MINGASRKRDDALEALKWLTDAMPDLVWKFEDLIVEDDCIAARLRDSGTPIKKCFGVEPKGVSFEITEFASHKVRDGRFAEMWFFMDAPSAARQLG